LLQIEEEMLGGPEILLSFTDPENNFEILFWHETFNTVRLNETIRQKTPW
jgi:hypothetical protein